MNQIIKGFSKLSKEQKTELIAQQFTKDSDASIDILKKYLNRDSELQKLHDGFSENTISNFYLPYGIAPNFLINGRMYAIPMVVEESSVVAALSKAGAFWSRRGGFSATVKQMIKKGQIHLCFDGEREELFTFFAAAKQRLLNATDSITKNMRSRGGGILDITLLDKSDIEEGFYQIDADFDTCDSMGANFINSCLETIALTFVDLYKSEKPQSKTDPQIIMSILSNYTPDCLVNVCVSAPIESMAQGEMSGEEFCQKFVRAVKIAACDTSRAVTHNKGIMNGVDAVIVATGNDFRAAEASSHAYAVKDGKYRSLSWARVENGEFKFGLDLPLSLGTVGGLTSLHPLSKLSMEFLGAPSAKELMCIAASVGLAQNYAAVSSLITTGIQKGHMKMHLVNIINTLKASQSQIDAAKEYFSERTVSFSEVEKFLSENQ